MFSWDARKDLRNLRKHGVSFEEAATVFSDPEGLDWDDFDHSLSERRSTRVGFSVAGRVLFVAYTIRRLKTEATDEQLRRARRVGRPVTGNAKQLIAIRIAPRLLAQLRRLAAKHSKPYQTFIHELLERAANKKVA